MINVQAINKHKRKRPRSQEIKIWQPVSTAWLHFQKANTRTPAQVRVKSSSHDTQKWSETLREIQPALYCWTEKECWGKIKLGRDSEGTHRWSTGWKIKPPKKDERNWNNLQPLKGREVTKTPRSYWEDGRQLFAIWRQTPHKQRWWGKRWWLSQAPQCLHM